MIPIDDRFCIWIMVNNRVSLSMKVNNLSENFNLVKNDEMNFWRIVSVAFKWKLKFWIEKPLSKASCFDSPSTLFNLCRWNINIFTWSNVNINYYFIHIIQLCKMTSPFPILSYWLWLWKIGLHQNLVFLLDCIVKHYF